MVMPEKNENYGDVAWLPAEKHGENNMEDKTYSNTLRCLNCAKTYDNILIPLGLPVEEFVMECERCGCSVTTGKKLPIPKRRVGEITYRES